MKNKLSRSAKSVVSILLTLCMILSVFSVAISSFGAAEVDEFAEEGAADIDIADTGAVPSTIYLKAGSNWDDADFDLKTAFNSGGDIWTNDHSSYVFTISVPSGATSGTFCRMDPSNHNNQWNYDGFTLDSNGKDLYVQNSGGNNPGGTWYKKTAYDDLSGTIGSGNGSKKAIGKIYFDNSDTGWTGTLYFVVAHGSYVKAYAMSKITGTNLYYVNQTSDTWSDAKYYGVMASSSTLSSTWTNGTSSTYAALASESSITKYSIPYSGSFNMNNSASTYILNHSISNSKVTITEPSYTSSGYSYFNHNQTIQARIPDGSGWKDAGSGVATLSIQSYALNGNGSSATATTNGSTGSVSRNTAYTSTVTMTAAASSSSYVFAGWGTSASTIDSSLGTGNYVYTASNSTKTIYAFFEFGTTELPTPTWSSSTVAANAGTAATLTVSNHSTIKGMDSGVTYVLKKGSTTLTSGTDYTFDNSTGVFTLADTTDAAAGSYTVQAIANDTTLYRDSPVSDPATLTVYEPLYCIIGNDLEAILVNGSVPTIEPAPTGSAYNNSWQPNFRVNNPTGTAGVYSFTFKVKEKADYQWDVQIGIRHETDGQKGFIYNTTPYNTASADLEVPDSGISSGLYAYNMAATSGGGSLFLKQGQTYTITIDQRECYNSSSPYGKITITTTDAFVDTVAKKQDFNATSRTYNSVSDASDSIGTVSAEPYHGTKSGFTSTLTATVTNNNYTFTGWYNNADCTGTAVSTSATYNVVDPGDSVTYYALFTQNRPTDYNVAITHPTGGTITLSGGVAAAGTSATTAYVGATVNMSINITDHSKEFSRWKITATGTGSDVTSSVLNDGSTYNSASFRMPPYNVTVTAVLTDKTPVTITTTSNDTSLGTASYTAGTYYVGEQIQLTATNVDGVFSRWQITGADFKSGSTATTKNPIIIPTGTTVTAKAIFEYKTYQLYYNGSYYTMVRTSDGKYISTVKVDSSAEFTISNVSESTKYYAVTSSNPYGLHSNWRAGAVSSWGTSTSAYKYKITDSNSYYVRYDPKNGTYGTVDILDSNPMGEVAEVYAKDGSIRYYDTNKTSGDLWENSTGGTTANRGTTVITKINDTLVKNPDSKKYPSTGLNEHLKVYTAPMGTTITVQTTINSSYLSKGYYVGMFVVNGWKVNASKSKDGVYTGTFTLTDEINVNNLGGKKSFEITPVYYNSNFEYITFYVDAASVPSKWGKTISACADYNGATNAHFEGTYPGQPLGREGDLYELKVAKYYYSYANSKWTAQTNYHPSATITAYNFDLVHHYYYVKATDEIYDAANNDNYQTYDYSDFAYLAQIPNIEAILFRCKSETSKSSWQIYNKSDSDANYNAKEPAWFYVDDKLSSFNTWQVLTDYYGNPIDALGNRVVKSGSGSSAVYYTADDVSGLSPTKNSSSQIRIVSYGNRKTDNDSANSRTAAKWSTGWAVYTGGSTSNTNYQVAYGTPADFICTTPGTDSTSKVHYINGKSASTLKNKLTFITYDKERTNQISGVGDTGERIDGQWYYSAMHEFDSDVQVHITTGSTPTSSNTTVDADSSAANTNNGWDGTTSGTTATLDGKTTETYANVTTEAALNCKLGSGYTFVGWYIYDGSTYTKIGDNYADANTTMMMKKNYTIVAVVKVVPEGSLAITHSKYTGSNPAANDGTGKYYVSATVYDSDGTTVKQNITEAQNAVTVENLAATDKIEITIRTVCDGDDTFYAWYEEALGDNYARTGKYYEICAEDEDPLGEKEVRYTMFIADCSSFFNDNTLARKTIDFYSDIVHVSAFATLTYKYYDRFAENGKGNMVSYVVGKVELDSTEIDNGYIPSDEKIALYAPNVIDTIYVDTKWRIVGTKVQRTASNITLMATQDDKNCDVQYIAPVDATAENLFSGGAEKSVDDISCWTNKTVAFNDYLSNDQSTDMEEFYVKAPEMIVVGADTWSFVKYEVYKFDRATGEIGQLLYSTSDNPFGYRIYEDCTIYPVYSNSGAASNPLTASIESAVLNREVYTEGASVIDRLYVDLIVAYLNTNRDANGDILDSQLTGVIKDEDPSLGYTFETGVILDSNVKLSTADYNTLKTAAEQGGADTTASILEKYTTGFATAAQVENVAKNDASVTGLTKSKNTNSNLTNKNRLDKVIRLTNKQSNQERVLLAYSYVVIRRNGGIVGYAVSDPQKFNLCYVANRPLETVN